MMYDETFKTATHVFIGNIIMCLTSQTQITDNIILWDQRKNVQITDNIILWDQRKNVQITDNSSSSMSIQLQDNW